MTAPRYTAKDVILLGEVAARGASMIEVRCRRCDRVGRLSVQWLVAQHGPNAPVPHVMEAEVVACPNRDSAQIQNRCGPYSPTLGRLFGAREPG